MIVELLCCTASFKPCEQCFVQHGKKVSCSNFGKYLAKMLLHRIEIVFREESYFAEKDPLQKKQDVSQYGKVGNLPVHLILMPQEGDPV